MREAESDRSRAPPGRADPAARTAFDSLDRIARYLVMLPLLQAATPENRQARLERAIRDVAQGPQNTP